MSNPATQAAITAFYSIAKSLPARIVVTLILLPAGPIGWLIIVALWVVAFLG